MRCTKSCTESLTLVEGLNQGLASFILLYYNASLQRLLKDEVLSRLFNLCDKLRICHMEGDYGIEFGSFYLDYKKTEKVGIFRRYLQSVQRS